MFGASCVLGLPQSFGVPWFTWIINEPVVHSLGNAFPSILAALFLARVDLLLAHSADETLLALASEMTWRKLTFNCCTSRSPRSGVFCLMPCNM